MAWPGIFFPGIFPLSTTFIDRCSLIFVGLLELDFGTACARSNRSTSHYRFRGVLTTCSRSILYSSSHFSYWLKEPLLLSANFFAHSLSNAFFFSFFALALKTKTGTIFSSFWRTLLPNIDYETAEWSLESARVCETAGTSISHANNWQGDKTCQRSIKIIIRKNSLPPIALRTKEIFFIFSFFF